MPRKENEDSRTSNREGKMDHSAQGRGYDSQSGKLALSKGYITKGSTTVVCLLICMLLLAANATI